MDTTLHKRVSIGIKGRFLLKITLFKGIFDKYMKKPYHVYSLSIVD